MAGNSSLKLDPGLYRIDIFDESVRAFEFSIEKENEKLLTPVINFGASLEWGKSKGFNSNLGVYFALGSIRIQ